MVSAQPDLFTPAEHGAAGAADSAKHTADHMPGWLLTALGNAFLAQRGKRFTSDDVRRVAGPTVNAWLDAEPERRNCLSGWFNAAVKRHHLLRVGSTPSTRDDARGRWVSQWEFPTP